MQVGPLTEVEGSIFGIRPLEKRPYEFKDDVHMLVSYEFDLNKRKIDREVYNLFDWLGDLGGLKTALLIILSYVNSLVNYYTFEDFLVSKLFRPSNKNFNKAMFRTFGNSTGVRSEILNPKKNGCLKKRWHNIKPLFCKRFTKSSRRQRLFEKGREELQHETDALTLIKYVRSIKKLIEIKMKLTERETHRVEKAKYKKITLTADEDGASPKL